MNKKKIASIVACLCLAASAVVGGTLAYFTDTDTKTNTFTTGNVAIKLEEVFPETKLLPGENNALTKKVTVKNTGTEDAYMWIELWIPSKIDEIGDPVKNSLHFNPFDTYVDDDDNEYLIRGSIAQSKGYTLKYETVEVSLGSKNIDGVDYNGYREYIKNDTPKRTNESTAALLARVFMDKDVTQCTQTGDDHKNCFVLPDGTHYTGSWEIIVNGFGIQADGFANIEEAIAAFNG